MKAFVYAEPVSWIQPMIPLYALYACRVVADIATSYMVRNATIENR
jgi:hypothetical protein